MATATYTGIIVQGTIYLSAALLVLVAILHHPMAQRRLPLTPYGRHQVTTWIVMAIVILVGTMVATLFAAEAHRAAGNP